MPLFILPFLWFLTVVLGILLLVFKRVRSLGISLIVIPTCAGVGSLILGVAGMALVALAERLFHFAIHELAPAVSFLAGAVLGAVLGIVLGALVCKKVIRRFGW